MRRLGKKNPKVSIITVCLNSDKTIRNTIESVIHQTYENIEYIIIDGGSTDHTLDIIDEYRGKIDSIVSEKDNGIYDAFNKGIIRANGEIIGIINSDDWYTCNAVEMSVNSLINNDAELCCGNIYVVEGETITNVFYSEINSEQFCGAKIRHPSVFVYKKLYNEIGLFDTNYKIAADYKWLLEVFLNNHKITYINKEIVFFRRGGISNNRKNVIQTLSESYSVVNDLIYKYDLDPNAYAYALEFWKNKLIKTKFDILLETKPRYVADYIKNKNDCDTIVIWGAGYYGRMLLSVCIMSRIKVEFLVDSDPIKQQRTVFQIPISPPEIIDNTNAVIIIAIDLDNDKVDKIIRDNHIDRRKVITLNEIRNYICLNYDDIQIAEI